MVWANPPAGFTSGVQVGAPDAATVVDLVNDPLCPDCGLLILISRYSAAISQAIDDGNITARFHLLKRLDPLSPETLRSRRLDLDARVGALMSNSDFGRQVGGELQTVPPWCLRQSRGGCNRGCWFT